MIWLDFNWCQMTDNTSAVRPLPQTKHTAHQWKKRKKTEIEKLSGTETSYLVPLDAWQRGPPM